MANADVCRGWLPELWERIRTWHLLQFQSEVERPLPHMLLGTLTALLIERNSSSKHNILPSMIEKCSRTIDRSPDVDLYQCNPLQLTLTIRLIERQREPLSDKALEYCTYIGDALNDGLLSHWQVPAFEILIRKPPKPQVGDASDLGDFENYANNFGRILGQIESETLFGLRTAEVGTVPRTLLYAGASRAISRNDIVSGARALRCLNYVSDRSEDRAEVHHLFDAICARQESAGHFGTDGDLPGEELRRVFECLWAIAEVSTPYRLFIDLAAPGVTGSVGRFHES